jgi:hypothetical protein
MTPATRIGEVRSRIAAAKEAKSMSRVRAGA